MAPTEDDMLRITTNICLIVVSPYIKDVNFELDTLKRNQSVFFQGTLRQVVVLQAIQI